MHTRISILCLSLSLALGAWSCGGDGGTSEPGMATGGTTVVVQHVVKQTLVTEPYGGGLFGCFNDFGDCLFTMLCPGIVHGMTSSRFADGTACGGVCVGNCIGWYVLTGLTGACVPFTMGFSPFCLCECRPSARA